jgi:hypothetical protein
VLLKDQDLFEKAKARTQAELEKALAEALLLVSAEDAIGWFKSCGYAIH